MRAIEANRIRLQIFGDAPVDFNLRQEVAGRVFYLCQCGAFRSHEIDVFDEVDTNMLYSLKEHVRECHETEGKR